MSRRGMSSLHRLLRTWTRPRRTSSSSSNTVFKDYLNILHKKLLFHIHPDYFMTFPDLQKINQSNCQLLAAHLQGNAASSAQTRSLIFYLKPSDVNPLPRRIKVSLLRLSESMREILEDLDCELPDAPAAETTSTGGAYRTGYSSIISTEDVERFLDTLTDRKDLIAWRQQRSASFLQKKEIVEHMLGSDGVELRCSLSAQYCGVLFSSLLRLLEQIQYLRLDGLRLILTADDFLQSVDAVEGHVLLNPAHVPSQWQQTLQSISPRHITEARLASAEIAALTTAMELDLGTIVRRGLSHACGQVLSEVNVRVKVSRGHTCSQRWFLHLLHDWGADHRENPVSVPLALTRDNNTTPHQSSTSTSQSFSCPTHATATATAPATFSALTVPTAWIARLPLTLDVVIEEGHGTRLLKTGSFRIDCRANRDKICTLLSHPPTLHEAAQRTVDARAAEHNRLEKSDRIRSRLDLVSLEPGVGVGPEKFAEFLHRLDLYLCNQRGNNKGVLGSLSGLKVRAGRYLGMSDDGGVMLPWELSLPTVGHQK